jgi:hypothetical protein
MAKFARSVLHIELSGALQALLFSFTTEFSTALLPVRISRGLFCSIFAHAKQVISNGVLFSTLSKDSRHRNVIVFNRKFH